jgi:methionyl aminopeptidase
MARASTITIKTEREIASMRIGGQILGTILKELEAETKAGMTPKDISTLAKAKIARHKGASAAFLGYQDYPDVICISVNDQVQHCIPDSRVIEEGDIVNLDFGITFEGMVTDAAITFGIGKISGDDKRLLEGTKKALDAAIKILKNGVRVGDISSTVESVLLDHDLGIVRELVGHGVGHDMHEDPDIPNYGWPKMGPVLKSGMTICIEPIATLGSEDIYMERDGWSLRTRDSSKAAQFEHTLLITDDGCEILTLA